MAQIIIPASGAVQVRIAYSLENIADGTAYGKTRVTITGMEASNATGIAGYGRPAFDVKAVLRSNSSVYSLHSFPGNTAAPLVPLGAGFAAFPGLSAVSVDIPRTARNEQFQFQLQKYAGYGGGGWNPCFVYGSPSKALFLGNQVSATPWGSALIDLPDAASASSTGDVTGTIGTAIYIPINRNNASLTHRLTYAFGGASGVIGEDLATNASWTPPMELCSQLPASTVGQGTLTCETFSAGTKIGETTATLTLYVPESVKPTISPGWAVLTYDNAGTAAASVDDFVRNFSKAKVTIVGGSTITPAYNSPIARYYILYAGARYDAANSVCRTGILTAPGEQQLTAVVQDSRGRTASEILSFTVQDYAAPALDNVSVFRCDADGNPSDSGIYYYAKAEASYSSIGGKNAVTLSVRHKTTAGIYGDSQLLVPGESKIIGQILATSTYTVEITAEDSLGQRSVTTETLPTAAVAMNLRKGSDGVAFGKYSEHPKTLELPEGWHIEIGEKPVISNPNLLDNPWFTVNQRNATTWASGYGVDRWYLAQGTAVMTVNGITLNGTLRQKLENSIGEQTTASVKMVSGSAAATYNDSTKIFEIVSSGGTIRAAKLETGSVSTISCDAPPDYATELYKCRRYYRTYDKAYYVYASGSGNDTIYAPMDEFNPPMRIVPSITWSSRVYDVMDNLQTTVVYQVYAASTDRLPCFRHATMPNVIYVQNVEASADL